MKNLFFILVASLASSQTWAWGKRGHETVGSLAAQLLSKQTVNGRFLSNHSFDMGYYNNTPDIVWKSSDDMYKKEWNQHFIDFEAFDKEFKSRNISETWSPDRKTYFEKFPIKSNEGRAFWRIHELDQKMQSVAKQLQNKKLKKEEKHPLQLQWLIFAGTLGHYVADLAQPLHVTENYDGRSSGQKGIHHWFEESMLDELYPSITQEVLSKATQQWPEFQKKMKGKTAFYLSIELARDSQKYIQQVLDTDKKLGRRSVAIAAEKNKSLIIERLTQGVLYLATIWNLQTDWGPQYDGDRFFSFSHATPYILPDEEPAPKSPEKSETQPTI